MIKNICSPVFLLVMIISCGESKKETKNLSGNENVDGGSCSYFYDTTPAMVYSVDTLISGQFELSLLHCSINANDSMVCDTATYRMVNGGYVSAEYLAESLINTGDTICFVTKKITSGSCNPDDAYYVLEKYRKKNQ